MTTVSNKERGDDGSAVKNSQKPALPRERRINIMAGKRKVKTNTVKRKGSIRKRTYQKKDGSVSVTYEVRVDGGYDKYGKRNQISKIAKTEEDANELLSTLCLDITNATFIPANAITLKEFIEKWLAEATSQAASSITTYRENARRYIYPHLGDIKLQELRKSDLNRWVKKLQDPEYAIKKPLCAKTVYDVYSFLHEILDAAVEEKIIKSNPYDKKVMKSLKEAAETQWIPVLEEEDIPKLLDACKGNKYERFIRFSLFVGLREMENLAITISDIDFKHRQIHVHYQLRKDLKEIPRPGETLHFKRLKTSSERYINFDEEIEKLLREQIAYEAAKKRRLGAAWPTDQLEKGDMLFSNDRGYYLSYRTVYDNFKKCAAKIGRPEIRLHDLRHTYVMLALKNGADPKTVSQSIGHKDVTFTMKVYAYVTNNMREKSSAIMNSVIRALDGKNRTNERTDASSEVM